MSKRRRPQSTKRLQKPEPAAARRKKPDAGGVRAPESAPVTAAAEPPEAEEPLFNVTAFTKPAFWVTAGLLALTVFVYAPVRGHDFAPVDDPGYLTQNTQVSGGLSAGGLAWAFTTGHMANWHPLTWISHMVDAELLGMRPGAHHVVNVLFHAANTLLLFALLRRMTGSVSRSAFVAALFAAHPLHVESVAWLSERKDVLSTLFWLLTMWMYVGYVERPSWMRYLGALGLFALGLMAKPMLVTLPFVLLLMDYWPLQRATIGRNQTWTVRRLWPLVREKLPFLALAIASSAVTLIVQREGGAIASLSRLPVTIRISNALVSYLTYLRKTFWPFDLAAFYPYNLSLTIWWGVMALAALAAITFVLLRASRSRPYLAVGWFWYLGTLVPVIGLVQVGVQSVADRYTYIPLIGIFLIIAWVVPDLLARIPARRVVLAALSVAIAIGCGVVARAQARTWRDGEALWTHALEVTERNYLAHNLLGGKLGEQGRHLEAIEHLRESIRLDPAYPDARFNLGVSLASLGRFEEAIPEYQIALRLNPQMASGHMSLGLAYSNLQRYDEAIPAFEAALRLDATLAEAHRGLALALSRRGRAAEADRHYAEAVRLDPDAADAQRKLGKARFSEGKIEEALAGYREALRLKPDFAQAHSDLGFALMALRRPDEATASLREALRLDPELVEAHLNMGFMLAAGGKFEEALPHFTEAVRLSPTSELAHSYRAIALSNLGHTDEAKREFQEVLRINPSNDGARRGLAALDARGGSRSGRGGGS